MKLNPEFWANRHVVYRVFDDTDRLVYVGQTNHLARRVTEHKHGSWWWSIYATRIAVQVFPIHEAAAAVERTAIQEETPVFNQRGVRRWREDPNWSDFDRAIYADWKAELNARWELRRAAA